MVQIQNVKKFSILRQAAEGAKRTASTLRESLLAAQQAIAVSTIVRGRLTVSTSGSGQSASYEISAAGKEWTQDNLLGLSEELIWVCDHTIAQGVPDAAVNELIEALFAAMCQNYITGNLPQLAVTEEMGNWASLNYPGQGYGGFAG